MKAFVLWAINENLNAAYALNSNSNTINVIATDEDILVAAYDVGSKPALVGVNRLPIKTYVTNGRSDDVTVIDNVTGPCPPITG